MTRRPTRRWWLASLLGLLTIGDRPSPGQAPAPRAWSPLLSALDPRLEATRRAATSWESRGGPERVVVDQVCLVPDLPTFLAAVATWDRGHYFPVLFDDVESSFRFLRAFRPARIIRMPRSAAAIAPNQVWANAVEAVGASWRSSDPTSQERLPGDLVPQSIGATPPGMVFSSPTSPMLPGAVALAAGHFQPLVRLDLDKHYADVLSLEDADALGRAIARKVAELRPQYEELGDDCDFLTLGGDSPYRYRGEQGESLAIDDRLGRRPADDRRWAFAGRLLGNATESAYRAMCSLFLQPESAVLFNTYEEGQFPWSLYSMRTAAPRLNPILPTAHVAGSPQAGYEGWHETFDPSNRFGLILVNSQGSPEMFNIQGRHARAPDVPRGVPSAVLMIHSYAAADPIDPATVAGRWLANGAFLFYGSMDEPYLDAFRAPQVIAELIARRLPLVVAARQVTGESRAAPWKLVFLGDPLYRIAPKGPASPPARLDRWGPTSSWPAYSEAPRPPSGETDLFFWALKAAIAKLQGASRRSSSASADEPAETLLAMDRGKLPNGFRAVYDALLIETLLDARRRSTLRATLSGLPLSERSPSVRRALETIESADFFLGFSSGDFARAQAAWLELMKSSLSRDYKNQLLGMVAALASTPARLEAWRSTLEAAQRDRSLGGDAVLIGPELKRVQEALRGKR